MYYFNDGVTEIKNVLRRINRFLTGKTGQGILGQMSRKPIHNATRALGVR